MGKQCEVVIIGGGLLGCSVFALATAERQLKVHLLERNRELARESTAMNQGRCHSGASSLRSDPAAVTARKQAGSRYLRPFSIWDSRPQALYACKTPELARALEDACNQRDIPTGRVNPARLADQWLKPRDWQGIELYEPSFNTAGLACWLAALGQSRGGEVSTEQRVRRVRRRHDRLVVEGADNEIVCDVVVNAASKYVNDVQFEDAPRLLDLEFYRWPIMAIPAAGLPVLDRVIVALASETVVSSVLPHGPWLTFDCKTIPERVEHADAYPSTNPGSLRPTCSQERDILESVDAFAPLRSVIHDKPEEIRVVYGVHGRRVGEPETSDLCRSYRYEGVPRYIIRHGGLATTALLDASELVEELCAQLGLPTLDPEAQRRRLLANGTVNPLGGRMLYETDTSGWIEGQ